MDILHMVNLRKTATCGTPVDLNHVKTKISMPLVLQNPGRAGSQQDISFPLIDPP